MPFHNEYSRPVAAQYAAIGRVAANWSVVEFALEIILARLARAPDYFGMALTNDLSIENRLAALRNLCQVHQIQVGYQLVSEQSVALLRSLAREVATAKARRNQIVHYVWFRETDDRMFGARFRTKPPKDRRDEGTSLLMTNLEIEQFADDITNLADRLCDAASALPELAWP